MKKRVFIYSNVKNSYFTQVTLLVQQFEYQFLSYLTNTYRYRKISVDLKGSQDLGQTFTVRVV